MQPDPLTRLSAAALFEKADQAAGAGQPAAAADLLVAGLQLMPSHGPAYVTLATILRQFGSLDLAGTMIEAALALMPDDVLATLGLAALLHDRGDFTGATAVYRGVLRQHPDHAGAKSSLARTLLAAGHAADTLPLHAEALDRLPEHPDARYSHAEALLMAGDFARGWAEYEWRWQGRQLGGPRGFGPAWQGEYLHGQTILLHAEQGFGDTLQFCRYAPLVAARGGRVVLEAQRPLVRLMRSLDGVAEVVARGDALPAFSAHCPLMSLPLAFGTQVHTIPAAVPYLRPDPAQAAAWAASLPRMGGRRVGLVWAGSPHSGAIGISVLDARRSMPLAALESLGSVPGVQLINLQAGAPAGQLASPPPGLAVLDYMGQMRDFADTAALVANLDLVITVDTAVAHLAGALGRPVWVMSRSDGCWRWLQGRDDSPWYPTLRLYRQAQPLDWAPVVARVRADLAAFAEGAPAAPG